VRLLVEAHLTRDWEGVSTMDPRQRSLIATAIQSNPDRVQNRLRCRDSYAVVEVAEFLQEIGDEELAPDVIASLVSCLPPAHARAVVGAHRTWALHGAT
jgi:hypothetical protein